MDNKYGICRIAVAPLRADANDRAEIVSQLLFGDHVKIIDSAGHWWLVENAYDSYQGWMDFRQLAVISEQQFNDINTRALAPLQFDNVIVAEDGSTYHLNAGSTLPFYANGLCYVGDARFEVTFNPHFPADVNFGENVISTAKFFLNTPYLWGGRNIFGIDCSGFVQLVFKLLGIKLRRDARQQAEEGELVGFLSECRPGDVAFFDNDEGKITHVGIMIDNQTIIHASGKVKIDPIDNQGIFSKELGRYTQKLRIIKRFME